MKVLVKNESPSYSSETIQDVDGNLKFKIVSENGNSHSHLRIYIYTNNGDLALVANEYDISDYRRVDYIDNDARRQEGNKKNLIAAEKYIKKVWKC
jgi:hypothetical protein